MLYTYNSHHSSSSTSLISQDQRQHSSRSNQQLHRYSHDPVSSNLLHRDIPPILILLFFLFLIIITLSQILVVHTSRYGANFSSMQKIQEELKQMDESMEAMLRENVLPIEQWRLLFRIQAYLSRFEDLFGLWGSSTTARENSMSNKTKISSEEYQRLQWKYAKARNSQPRQNAKRRNRNYCSEEPRHLHGRFLNENSTFPNVSLHEIETNYSNVRSGGQWSPTHCLARYRVAIIIPYRDRFEHLVTLLYYLHPILQRQELDYKIYVSEQDGNGTYNKAVLMNAAFLYASSEYDFQCFVFHDVDLIPEDDRNMYSCPIFPRHMSVAIDEMNYKLTYEELIGGVLNIRNEHFLAVNGYSNLYWGWGAEDDDLYYRFKEVSIKIIRPPASIARYKMLQHTKRVPSVWNKRAKLLYSAAKRYTWDGVSSARYNITSVITYPLFTHLTIDVGLPPPGFS
ncbi:unnamed protein product [Adineta ricciae]|uniref:Beta-1,4-galactosyltransferase n=1 Tax=Adineta ricciae TaxID=249248 RepID=A0A813VPQ5_ADIRI|nr:unnamed protein product [Adineta ricciae]